MDLQIRTTGPLNVILHGIAGCEVKHGAGVTDKGNVHFLVARQCNGNGAVPAQLCAGLQRHANLNVLKIVLVKWEHMVCRGLADDTTGCIAAAVVRDLEALVYGASGFHIHTARAFNIAPCVQRATSVNSDRTVGVHVDEA